VVHVLALKLMRRQVEAFEPMDFAWLFHRSYSFIAKIWLRERRRMKRPHSAALILIKQRKEYRRGMRADD
jgi:hypothetical protein